MVLERAAYQQQLLGANDVAAMLVDRWLDDHVDEAEFGFECQEAEAFGGGWDLANDEQPSVLASGTVRLSLHVLLSASMACCSASFLAASAS